MQNLADGLRTESQTGVMAQVGGLSTGVQLDEMTQVDCPGSAVLVDLTWIHQVPAGRWRKLWDLDTQYAQCAAGILPQLSQISYPAVISRITMML